MSDLAPGPHSAPIRPRVLNPSLAVHDTPAPVDRLLREWLRLRTIVDRLLERAAGRNGTASDPIVPTEHVNG